ncbi:MAG: hypothetical protein HDQ95_11845 [Roseburia sp.]|nr:hypothetical protein [Roseburia sp.]
MKKLRRYTIIGIIFVLVIGTLSHFVYEWSGHNFILGLFSPVNESTWEHMKLCFFPMLLYSLYMNAKIKHDFPCITSSLLFGILLGTFSIPVFFYTYSGILGQNLPPLDVATFIASVLLSFAAVYKLTISCKLAAYTFILKLSVLVIAVCFFVFTCYPPDIGIFTIPVK